MQFPGKDEKNPKNWNPQKGVTWAGRPEISNNYAQELTREQEETGGRRQGQVKKEGRKEEAGEKEAIRVNSNVKDRQKKKNFEDGERKA